MRKLVLVMAVVVLLSLACGSSANVDTPTTPQEDAWYSCTVIIDKMYDISYLDAEDYNSNAVVFVEANVYNVLVYYPELDRDFLCEVTQLANGDASVRVQR